jgi:DNA-directed RNA polymerase subunit RPC12/RpoP
MLKFDWEQFEKEHEDKNDPNKQKEIECPNCGHLFTL